MFNHKYNKYFDHTNLKTITSVEDIIKLCNEALKYGFYSVCINPYYVRLAKSQLEDSDVKVCTVIGFPLGMNTLDTKIFETKQALFDGADEFDLVINLANLKKRDTNALLSEINAIKNLVGDRILKVIVETSQLDSKDKEYIAHVVLESQADFIKTSTGFIGDGAKVDDIKLFKKILKNKKKIKASGGIKNAKEFLEFIDAGADRIGASQSVKIVHELIK